MSENARESKFYLWMFEQGRRDGVIEGRLNEARRLVLRQVTRRFGEPDGATLQAIQDIDQLETLVARVFEPRVRDWDNLLRSPDAAQFQAPVLMTSLWAQEGVQ